MFLVFSALATRALALTNATCNEPGHSSESIISLTDLLFLDCTSVTSGGAVFIHNDIANLTVLSCQFRYCSSDVQAGCIEFAGRSAIVSHFTARNCEARGCAAFCVLNHTSLSADPINVTESSWTAGNCSHHSFHVESRYDDFPDITVRDVNATSNYVARHASGMGCGPHGGFDLTYSAFRSNSQGVLTLWILAHYWDADLIMCIEFFNNSIDSARAGRFPGLISIATSLVIGGSIFMSNKCDWLVSRLDFLNYTDVQVQFYQCVIDSGNPWEVSNLTATIMECETGSGTITFYSDGCRTPSATQSSSPLPSASPAASLSPPATSSPSLSVEQTPAQSLTESAPFSPSRFPVDANAGSALGRFPLVGIVGAGVAGAVLVIAAVACIVRSRRQRSSETVVLPAAAYDSNRPPINRVLLGPDFDSFDLAPDES
jgi:hypothetical protein